MGVLIWGADLIISQSERSAVKFNIPEFIIGATLIALGTSLPEMAASIAASYNGKPEIAVANVIGSNVLNITLVLATVFLIASKIHPNRDFFAKDSTWALVPVLVFILMILDGVISRFDATLLLLLMGAYLLFLLQDAKNMPKDDLQDLDESTFSWAKTIPISGPLGQHTKGFKYIKLNQKKATTKVIFAPCKAKNYIENCHPFKF